ncbi:kinase-like domain-containing protein [Glomus cerebriforme]|uniref:Kinase-like domain-containing protein n=1 Tax=Glomus cerebriforme TaxID=658196 RepID=A0A397SVW3_9GLOM|nr:kinase-like domain-containing protein [Glomus cerebriforme]
MVLHDNGIIHENLNPKNILIFNGIAKISNLPLPFGKEDFNNEDLYIESNDFKNNNLYVNTEIFDIIGYVDPNVFIKGPSDYVKAKSVDIYSLGTLLWEIMSEKVPHQENGIRELVKNITGGVKEADIPGISVEYKNLYTKCWDVNSDSRPTIKDVYNQLSNMK